MRTWPEISPAWSRCSPTTHGCPCRQRPTSIRAPPPSGLSCRPASVTAAGAGCPWCPPRLTPSPPWPATSAARTKKPGRALPRPGCSCSPWRVRGSGPSPGSTATRSTRGSAWPYRCQRARRSPHADPGDRCSVAAAAARLQVGEPEQEQQHDGADDGPDEAHGVEAVHVQRVVLPQVVEETADEGAGDADDDSADDADGVAAWEKKAGQSARDQPDDDDPDYESNHVHEGSRAARFMPVFQGFFG